uniref:DNA topoisomerase n=1 Tax=Globodera rostochiensis TaxID=31243 RepID=A0A914HDJ8_GLORO
MLKIRQNISLHDNSSSRLRTTSVLIKFYRMDNSDTNELIVFCGRGELVKKLAAKGIRYIFRNEELQEVLNTPKAGTDQKPLHNILLFHNQSTATNLHDTFGISLWKLFKMADVRNNCIFVDLEIILRDRVKLPDAIHSLDGFPEVGARLIKMRGDQLLTSDCVAAEIEKLTMCTARIKLAQQTEVGAVPSADQKLLPFVLPCPLCKSLGGQCPNDDFLWCCDDCGQQLSFVKQENAPITHLFCDCGRTSVEEFTFRCAYFTSHGDRFSRFSTNALDLALEMLNRKNEASILQVKASSQNGQQSAMSSNVSSDQAQQKLFKLLWDDQALITWLFRQ